MISLKNCDYFDIINKTIALIYGSSDYKKWLKVQKDARRKSAMEGKKFLRLAEEAIEITTEKEDGERIIDEIFKPSKTPICDGVFFRKRPYFAKKKHKRNRCVCANMIDHFLRCKNSFLPFIYENKENGKERSANR